MMRHFLLKERIAAILTVAVLFFMNSVMFAQDERTWRDISGKFSVEAELVEFDGKNVKLKKTEDNRVVTMPLEKLSLSDQRYLRRLKQDEAANPFAGGEPTTGRTGTTRTTNTGQAATGGSNVRRGDASDAEKIVPGLVSGWNYTPVPIALNGENANYKPCPITLDKMFGIFESLDIVKTPNAAIAVVSQDNHDTDSTFVYVMNMNTGKTLSHDLKYKAQVWGISPDGKRVVVTSKDYQNEVARGRLDFYGITDKGLTRTSSLAPYADSQYDYNRNVEWAGWISPTHVLTCNREHVIRLWDLKTGKAVYTMTANDNHVILSKDRKAMVVGTKSGVMLCDTMTGETLGKICDETPFLMKFDFSPDNTQLLGVMTKRPDRAVRLGDFTDVEVKTVSIWDLKSGKQIGETALDAGISDPQWIDNRMIMKGNTLYDSQTGVPVCHYEGSFNKAISFDGLYCYLFFSGQNDYILSTAKLPHKAALDAATNVDIKSRFALYPGAEVSLKVETDGSADEKDIRNRIEQNLKDAGFVVKDSAKVQFVASVKKSAEGDVTYSGDNSPFPRPPLPRPSLFGRGPEVDVKITAHESVLTILNNGKEFWKFGVIAVPESITLDKDRSIQEVADELCKPDLEFFARTPLPRYHTGEAPPRRAISMPQHMQDNTSALINVTLTPTGVK